MGFTFVQKKQANNAPTGSPANISVVLTSAPTAGDIVCVALGQGAATSGAVLNTVKDSNNNSYTITPNSPSTFQSGAGQIWLAYLLSAPANASATITFNVSGLNTISCDMWAVEFSVSGGTVAFDKDAKANSATGTTINTPSITPAGSGQLAYAAASSGGTVSSAGTPWTIGTIAASGDADEYDLSISAATSVNWPETGGSGWSAMAMTFTFTASGGSTPTFGTHRLLMGVGN